MERPTTYDDVIDSRDVIAAIEEIEQEIADLAKAEEIAECREEIDDLDADDPDDAEQITELGKRLDALLLEAQQNADAIAELREELAPLAELAEQASGYAADWDHGETLIRDSYFKEYAQELAEEIGAINADASWPNSCIDWDQAARELQQDYTAVSFDGIDYWIR